jgi:hypothetical protein
MLHFFVFYAWQRFTVYILVGENFQQSVSQNGELKFIIFFSVLILQRHFKGGQVFVSFLVIEFVRRSLFWKILLQTSGVIVLRCSTQYDIDLVFSHLHCQKLNTIK